MMRILSARKRVDGYHFDIHLDESKILSKDDERRGRGKAGDPDLEWVVTYRWGIDPPKGVAQEAYEAQIINEAIALAKITLGDRIPKDSGSDSVLSVEGQSIPSREQ